MIHEDLALNFLIISYRLQNCCGNQKCQVGKTNLEQNPFVFLHLFRTFLPNKPNQEGIEQQA